MELAPPAKVQCPEGMLETGSTLAPYRPPLVEDDEVMGGTDEIGMAPEIKVDLETECEDLNADLITMDRQSDSPHPHSPRAADALDQYTRNNRPPVDIPFNVLRVVPSTQPVTPPPVVGLSSRRLRSRFRRRAADGSPPVPATSTALAPPTSTASVPPLAYSEHNYSAGRGILRLHVPHKLAKIPVPRRQPPPCGALPKPQWVIAVPTPPLVEYRAETPEPTKCLLEMPDAFQDADEDLRPLTGSWVEIIDQEMRDGTAVTSTAPIVTWALDAPVTASRGFPTAGTTTALSVPIPTPVLDLTGE